MLCRLLYCGARAQPKHNHACIVLKSQRFCLIEYLVAYLTGIERGKHVENMPNSFESECVGYSVGKHNYHFPYA